MRIGVVSGGFDPLHEGHCDYINAAKALCDILLVFPNSDAWLVRKKGKPFMNQTTRCAILSNFRAINLVIPMSEQDDLTGSADWAIVKARTMFPHDDIFFMNGGDRTKDNIPESETARKYKVELVFGVGGENKANSSSDILKNWEQD
jgi:cytidyltransferase-like protein